MAALVQSEVAKQLKALSERFDDIEGRLESLASSIKDGIVGAAAGMTGAASEPTPASPPSARQRVTRLPRKRRRTVAKKPTKKIASKKSGAKKSGAKKSRAKKSGAKKSGAKKSTAKKSSKQSAPDVVGSSGVRKVSTSRTAAASE